MKNIQIMLTKRIGCHNDENILVIKLGNKIVIM